ncbi:hypothetical protein SAMN06265365_10787 [Tistlia consotensis]|uniref:Uncharacterized protein n=1 Tax=Tistlia consotensis USBA 355 TaxID=560819 RepID=A0A1Y6B7V4_9PROT|nr:hypothetical protein [Tistlia consotensis]SME97600.1 hypothetical protein SAMN05428998_10289 [Tistlia consotensis USBA 355]SNR56942.1 hypothetical protein SAMN06265365_10787 [Tistlia consotensis]
MSNGQSDPLTGYDANVCVLGDQAFNIGQKVSYQGRILYCAPPGAWIDYGPSNPTPLLDRDNPGASSGGGSGGTGGSSGSGGTS